MRNNVMGKIMLVLALVSLLVPIGMATGEIAVVPYAITTTTEFVFSMDNITFLLRGPPGKFLLVNILDEANTTVHSDFAKLSVNGTGMLVWNVPVDELPGLHTAIIVENGKNMTNCQFEVIYDENLVQNLRMDGLQQQIDTLERMMRGEIKLVNALVRQRNELYIMCMFFSCLSFGLAIGFWFTNKPAMDYYWGQRGKRTGGKKLVFGATNAARRGQLSPYHPQIDQKFTEARAEREAAREGVPNFKGQVFIKAEPNNPWGVEITEVEVRDISELEFHLNPTDPQNVKKVKQTKLRGGFGKFKGIGKKPVAPPEHKVMESTVDKSVPKADPVEAEPLVPKVERPLDKEGAI